MKLRTIIIDDEAALRSRLRKLLNEHPEIEIVGEASDGLQAVKIVEQQHPDLIFLDVQMPGLTGIEVLQALSQHSPQPLVIFATAYDEYAMSAFEANAVAYLLKPINRERLSQAVTRVCKLFASETQTDGERQRIRQAVQSAALPLQQIVGRKRDRLILLRLDQVCLIYVEDSLVKIKTDRETYWSNYQIGELEDQLPEPPFFRARRAVIANLRKIKEIAPESNGAFTLIMNDQESTEIQVSERQSKKLRELLRI